MNRILDERDKVKLESSINATQESINNQIANLKGYADDNMEQLSEKVDDVNDRANNRISELQRKITTDIGQLNLQTNTKINNLNELLTNQINELDEEMSANISSLESNMNNKIDTLADDTSTQINTLEESTNAKISTLESDMSATIAALDTDLSAQIVDVDDKVTTLQGDLTTAESNLTDKIDNLDTELSAQISTLEESVSNLDLNKVDKVEGKALSENDLTDELKENYDGSYAHSLLAHAPSDAEMNVQANWAEEDNTADSYIQNKPTLGAMAAKSIVEKSDLSTEVQASLDLANTSLQSYTETDPTVPDWAKADVKPTYTASEVGALAVTVLPTITEEDEGKVLCVQNGAFALVSIADLLSNTEGA